MSMTRQRVMFACLNLASFSPAFLSSRYDKIYIGSGTWRARSSVMYPTEVIVPSAISCASYCRHRNPDVIDALPSATLLSPP